MERFSKFYNLITLNKFEFLQTKTVMIIGLGGVGGYVVEMLARCGIKRLIIIDFDKYENTNINRQLMASTNTLNMKKVDVVKQRIKDINNNCEVLAFDTFLDESNINIIHDVDYVVDAIDTIKTKELIIRKCLEENIRFITCLGMGNRLDPTKVIISELKNTNYDKLAKKLRYLLKDETRSIPVVFSKEIPIITKNEILSCCLPVAVAGILASNYIIQDILKD